MLRSNNTYVFGDFRLDLAEKVLLRDGKAVPVTPKVFETLQLFVENAGHLIEKDELMRKLWQDRFVEESNLTFNIKMLRKALGDNASKPKFIETVQRRGYRFIAETQLIEKEDNENGSSAVSTSQRRSAMRPLHPLIQKAAVVALAEWKNGASPAPPEASPLTTAELKLVPASPVARVGSKHLLLVMAGLLLGAIGLGYYLLYSRGAEAIDSVAILPFVNASGDNNTDYLSEAISDSIINSLSRLPNLKVNSLNSVSRYKGKHVDAQEVGRELNVRAVLISKFTQGCCKPKQMPRPERRGPNPALLLKCYLQGEGRDRFSRFDGDTVNSAFRSGQFPGPRSTITRDDLVLYPVLKVHAECAGPVG